MEAQTTVVGLYTTLGQVEDYLSGKSRYVVDRTKEVREAGNELPRRASARSQAQVLREMGHESVASEIEDLADFCESFEEAQ